MTLFSLRASGVVYVGFAALLPSLALLVLLIDFGYWAFNYSSLRIAAEQGVQLAAERPCPSTDDYAAIINAANRFIPAPQRTHTSFQLRYNNLYVTPNHTGFALSATGIANQYDYGDQVTLTLTQRVALPAFMPLPILRSTELQAYASTTIQSLCPDIYGYP
jgi:Flp pilus assembly protein TadG